MPIFNPQLQNFSTNQTNPALAGLMFGNQLQQANTQNQFLGPTLAAQLNKLQLSNQIMQPQADYAPQITQADLSLKQAQTPYVNSQTAMNMATIPFLGMKFIAPMINAQANMAKAGILNSNSFRAWTATPEGMAWVNSNPSGANSVLNALNNGSNMVNSGFGYGNVGINGIGGIPNINSNQNNVSPLMQSQLNQSANQMRQQPLPLSTDQINRLQSVFGNGQNPTPQQNVQTTQSVAGSALSNNLMAAPQLAQIRYGNVVDSLLQNNQKQINDAINYAGSGGKAGQLLNQYSQSLGGPSTDAYKNFDAFSNQTAPALSNELRRAWGGQATDAEKKAMDEIGNPISWKRDPQQAAADFNMLVNNLHANLREILKTPQQSIATANQNVNTPITFSPSGSGNPPAPVNNSAAPLQIPTFQTKADFVQWYNAQPGNIKQQYTQQLRGG